MTTEGHPKIHGDRDILSTTADEFSGQREKCS